MTFVGVEFINDISENGEIALVHTSWITPLKKEAWWPPYKTSAQFKKALIFGERPKINTWKLYGIKQILFSQDEYDKATKKLKKYEEFSDAQSSALENQEKKRLPKPNSRYISSSEEEDIENYHSLHRPPNISKPAHVLRNESLTPVIHQSKSISRSFAETDFSDTSACDQTETIRRPKVMSFFSKTTSSSQSLTVSANINPQPEPSNSTFINESCTGSCRHNFEQIFIEVREVREQLKEIRGILKQCNTQNSIATVPNECPVEFPLKTREELQLLENYLDSRENKNAVSLFLSTLGGDTTTTRTNRILKHVLTDELAKGFNFAGQKGIKEAFEKLHLKTVIVRGVQIKSPSTTEIDIENAIKIWLKHAPDRIKGSLKRKRP